MRSNTTTLKSLVLAGLLATLGAGAMAQTPAPADAASPPPAAAHKGPREGMHHRDPAKMQAAIAKRMAELKTKLKITSEQEPAWAAFTGSMKPPAPMAPGERADFAKLTTPERLDRLHALRVARNAEMDKREDATKTFYGALNTEQKTTFDAESLRMLQRMGHGGPGGPGGEHHRPMRDKS
ncbi:Spy/CpxP family protein refolding chaperone [Variovorax sp. HJSM1_2]|uniref:Spy/CpxP family protein refolding chaperone n=1 Tax=Variovorax sp. HJSM1_2 TaxID=3366263 RepID=UPI003BCAE827